MTAARASSIRASRRDSDALIVAGLSLVATAVALWDLALLAFAAR